MKVVHRGGPWDGKEWELPEGDRLCHHQETEKGSYRDDWYVLTEETDDEGRQIVDHERTTWDRRPGDRWDDDNLVVDDFGVHDS